jgi:hypothetical protein
VVQVRPRRHDDAPGAGAGRGADRRRDAAPAQLGGGTEERGVDEHRPRAGEGREQGSGVIEGPGPDLEAALGEVRGARHVADGRDEALPRDEPGHGAQDGAAELAVGAGDDDRHDAPVD